MSKIVSRGQLLFTRFLQAEIPVRAAALAYHTILAIVPIIGTVFWYLSAVGITKHWREVVKTFVLSHINVGSSEAFLDHFERFTRTVSHASWGLVGVAVLLYTSFSLIVKFGDALDSIFHTAHEEPRLDPKFLSLFLKRCVVLLGLPIAVALSVIVTSWLRYESLLKEIFTLPAFGPTVGLAFTWVVDIAVLFLVYFFVPKKKIRWEQALKAALIVAPIFEIAKFGVGVYNRHALSVEKLYGAFAAVPVFIIWVQVAWIIVLCGALLIDPRSRQLRATKV